MTCEFRLCDGHCDLIGLVCLERRKVCARAEEERRRRAAILAVCAHARECPEACEFRGYCGYSGRPLWCVARSLRDGDVAWCAQCYSVGPRCKQRRELRRLEAA